MIIAGCKQIVVRLLENRCPQVKVGVEAPQDVVILRGELLNRGEKEGA